MPTNLRRLACLPAFLLALLAAPLPAAAQSATGVIVEVVHRDLFEEKVEALGTLRANESVELTATVTERIAAINFEDGQDVAAGDVLAEMTSDEQAALLEEARAALAEAQDQYERVRPLADRGYATGTQLDERRREYETAQARLRAVESRLRDRLVIAPFAGVVGLRTISVGALVTPGTVITTLNDISVMKLDFSVPAPFLTSLRPGLPIRARATALGNRTFEGTVASVDNQVDPVTRAIMVRALIPNPDRLLRPGLLMSVELIRDPRETVVIAEEALIRRAGETYVYVAVPNGEGTARVEQRAVSVGGRRPGEVEITQGLTPGELVITHGLIKVRPGQEVTIQAEKRPDDTVRDLIHRKSS